MEEKNFLRYGDKILLQTCPQEKENIPSSFLSARSLLEEDIFFIQLMNSQIGITMYDNYCECIFQILPKLRYEAVKTLRKVSKEKNLSNEKIDIIKKRVENEKELNQIIINKYKGKVVELGSEIHLQHALSGCYINDIIYIRCLKNTHLKADQAGSLKLTQELDSGVVFRMKIDPYFTFKKDGEKITLEDSFYFINQKRQSILYFNQNTNLSSNLPRKNDQSIHFPSIMEINRAFGIKLAGHIKNNTNTTKKLLTFQAIIIDRQTHYQDDGGQPTNEHHQVHWGDFVQIKHILKEEKSQKVEMSCSINVNGFSPHTFMVKSEQKEYKEKEQINTFFQIIPDKPSLLGSPIIAETIRDETVFPPLIFRHWITGKYLSLNPSHVCNDNQKNPYISLQDSISEFIEKNNFTICPESPQKQKRANIRQQTIKFTQNMEESAQNSNLNM